MDETHSQNENIHHDFNFDRLFSLPGQQTKFYFIEIEPLCHHQSNIYGKIFNNISI